MPKNVREHVQQALWWGVIEPLFIFGRHFFTLMRRVFMNWERQEFPLGWIAPHKDIHDLVLHLRTHGFRGFRCSWQDPGQKVNLRRRDTFHSQYHIRIFEDGEIRAHYEKSPEAHPFDHLFGHGLETRREEFLKIFGEWLVLEEPQLISETSEVEL